MKRYETSDVSATKLGVLLIVCVAGTAVLHLSLGYGLRRLRSDSPDERTAPGFASIPPEIPAPKLEVDETARLRIYRAKERARMDRYEWVDRAQGIARIPVERAMVLSAEGK